LRNFIKKRNIFGTYRALSKSDLTWRFLGIERILSVVSRVRKFVCSRRFLGDL